MLKIFTLAMGYSLLIASCDSLEKNDAGKMAATEKMKQKVQKVSIELKAYCDSETYRKARTKADSILGRAGKKPGF